MIRISAFADEIAPDPADQVRVLTEEGLRWVDLRAAWGTNVLELSPVQVDRLKEIFDEAGVGVAAIASPIGKTPIDAPVHMPREQLERAVQLAHMFGTRYIRVFSFYGPGDTNDSWQEMWRDEVLARMKEMTRVAESSDVVLVHENEREIYGDTVERCVDLLESTSSPNLRAAFDPANFIQCGQRPYPDAFQALLPWIEYVHIKDATADGAVVPAGRGAAEFPEFLARLRAGGYDGVLALEPHLGAQGRFSGFSGPDLFREAAGALRELLDGLGWEHA